MPEKKDFRIFPNPDAGTLKERGYEPRGMPELVADDLLHYSEEEVKEILSDVMEATYKNMDGVALWYKAQFEKNGNMNAPDTADIVHSDGEPCEGDRGTQYTIVLGLKKIEDEK